MRLFFIASLVAVTAVVAVFCVVATQQHAKRQLLAAAAQAMVNRWADQLDAQTDETGIYIRHQGEQLPENDPWGRPLTVTYTQGGVAESLTVRSFGPDGVSHTEDDAFATRNAVNLKGAGTGVRDNVEEFSTNSARGAVLGVVDELQQSGQGAVKGDDKDPL